MSPPVTVPAGLLIEVAVPALPPSRFEGLAEPAQLAAFTQAGRKARDLLRGRVVWNVNSTPHGGGVAEMLQPLLGCVRGVGVDARWLVIQGDPAFFRVTKRLHNQLHGMHGDGGELGDEERHAYESALAPNARELTRLVRPEDIVILHDPQTAGLVRTVKSVGARVVWRCHIGGDATNEVTRRAWRFLTPFVVDADAFVFSRPEHVWEGLDRTRVRIISPSIDVLSPKNRDLDAGSAESILCAAGILKGGVDRPPHVVRSDGSRGRIDQVAGMAGRLVPRGAPMVVQVSRWDHIKDPIGVLHAFADHVAPAHGGVHLALVGPEVAAVSDDPEGATVLMETTEHWARLPAPLRARVHLVCVPMADADVNAIIVNAIQRHAAIVVQKSLAEGFGLTVTEAMWKSRPVVGSRVGGIQDQIEDGVSGVLVAPCDLEAFGAAVSWLLTDGAAARRMGRLAHQRVRGLFLGPRHLVKYFELVAGL